MQLLPLESACVAALRNDRAFFESPQSRVMATNLETDTGVSPAERAALHRVRRFMPGGRAGNLVALERALTGALRALAS